MSKAKPGVMGWVNEEIEFRDVWAQLWETEADYYDLRFRRRLLKYYFGDSMDEFTDPKALRKSDYDRGYSDGMRFNPRIDPSPTAALIQVIEYLMEDNKTLRRANSDMADLVIRKEPAPKQWPFPMHPEFQSDYAGTISAEHISAYIGKLEKELVDVVGEQLSQEEAEAVKARLGWTL